jgi:hypothetical protein
LIKRRSSRVAAAFGIAPPCLPDVCFATGALQADETLSRIKRLLPIRVKNFDRTCARIEENGALA